MLGSTACCQTSSGLSSIEIIEKFDKMLQTNIAFCYYNCKLEMQALKLGTF